MEDCKTTSIPLPLGTSLSEHTGTPVVNQHIYYHIVGQLLYLTNTRSDLSYSLNYVSHFMAHPQLAHWHAVLHILRYLKGTIDWGIVYQSHHNLPLQGSSTTLQALQFASYSDAN